MKVVAIAQARMGSTRVPGKVMRKLGPAPVLHWTIGALQDSRLIDEIVLATSTLDADDEIVQYAKRSDFKWFRGSEDDVLDRFYQCAKQYKADLVLRLTCDCPFIDPNVVDEVIRLQRATGADYASNIDPPTYPDGLDVECFTFGALEAAHREAVRLSDRDCLTQFITRNRHRFPVANLRCPLPSLDKERWVLDTEKDWGFCKEIANYVAPGASYLDILSVLDQHPEIRQLNAGGIRNERFYEQIYTEQLPRRKFVASQGVLSKSTDLIPFGAQTFSKSHLQFPPGAAPLYVTHGDGARLFDVDGNDYVDLVNAVLPVVLGYRDRDVDDAIRTQLDRGISFSLATELEYELASILNRLIPCAEMVKFGKSGTDVTTAAVRLARASTGRDKAILTGYHGWADWSMVTTDRRLGIPPELGVHSIDITYGDAATFTKETKPNDVACIIVEPNGDPDFLRWLRTMCDHKGIVLIFDEIITGFRWHMGGAQSYYGVTPDLACFGKAMANGMPISAIVGRRDIMSRMQPPENIFYSGTMFGETLSIAAAIATIRKLERENVVEYLWKIGGQLQGTVLGGTSVYDLRDCIQLSGPEVRQVLTFKDGRGATANQIRTLFMQEMIQNGVLIINSHNTSWSIKDPEMKRICKAYADTFKKMDAVLTEGSIAQVIGREAASVAPLRR